MPPPVEPPVLPPVEPPVAEVGEVVLPVLPPVEPPVLPPVEPPQAEVGEVVFPVEAPGVVGAGSKTSPLPPAWVGSVVGVVEGWALDEPPLTVTGLKLKLPAALGLAAAVAVGSTPELAASSWPAGLPETFP